MPGTPRRLLNRMLIVLATALMAATAVVFVAHERQDGQATAQQPSTATASDNVQIKDFLYDPEAITVAAGTKLTFTNQDNAPHTATSQSSGGFDTGTLTKGQSKTINATKTGTFAYICTIHPFMKGTVIVK
jgi:plastocyanin